MSERDAAIVREVTALIVEAEQGVRELYPRLYEQMEADGGATCLTTRQLREAIARGEAAGEVSPGTAAECPLRERYAEVINQSTEVGRSWTEHDVADAVVAVRDDVLAETEWMRDHWERCFNEANGSAADALRGLSAAEAEVERLREALAKVEGAHPLIEQRRCGARLARPIDPPPGPPDPPRWCALDDDGHERHRTHDGAWLDLFRLPIEMREAVVSYRCETCGRYGKTPEDACHVRAALASVPAVDAGDREPASEVQP